MRILPVFYTISISFALGAFLGYCFSSHTTSADPAPAVLHDIYGAAVAPKTRGLSLHSPSHKAHGDTHKPPKFTSQTSAHPKPVPKHAPEVKQQLDAQGQPVERATNSEEWSHLEEVVRKVKAAGGGNRIVLTFANSGYEKFFDNWVGHTMNLGWSKEVVVGAIDDGMFAKASDLGLFAIAMNSTGSLAETLGVAVHTEVRGAELGSREFRSNAQTFHKMGGEKAALVLGFLELGMDVLLSDSDTAWLRDPWDYLEALHDVDIAISSDCPSIHGDRAGQTPDRSRCTHHEGSREDIKFNTGVIYFRSGEPSRKFVRAWVKRLLTTGKLVYDQEAFNLLMQEGALPIRLVERGGRTFHAWRKQIRLSILPATHFCNGHTFFIQRRPQMLGLHPFVVHPTFQLQGPAGKVARFREAGLWLSDPPEYYRGKFLTYSGEVPPHVYSGLTGVRAHMAVTAYHATAVRNAFALARILGRVVVLPPLLCFCDMYWGSPIVPDCITWGADLELPFHCPADNIFNLAHWDWQKLPYRLSGFLENPLFPDEIRRSRADVVAVAKGLAPGPGHRYSCGPDCRTKVPPGAPRPAEPKGFPDPEASGPIPQALATGAPGLQMAPAVVPLHGNETEIRRALAPYAGVGVLHLQASAAESFCGFDTDTANEKFDHDMGLGGFKGVFCCVPTNSPLKSPDQDPNEGVLWHKPPVPLASKHREDPNDPVYSHCQYGSIRKALPSGIAK